MNKEKTKKIAKVTLRSLLIVLLGFLTRTCIDYYTLLAEVKAENAKEPEIEFIMPNSSNEDMMELLKDRNGKLIIEICEGKVLDDEGNGESHYSDGNYYIHYDPDEYQKGDEVLSIFVYNPNTNAEDDITHRVDIKK